MSQGALENALIEAEQDAKQSEAVRRDLERLLKVLGVLRAEEQSRKLDPETLDLLRTVREEYQWVRVLDDGSIAAVGRLVTTTAVYLGMNRYGWERRYCYTDLIQALEVLYALKSEDDEPEGWVARRPEPHPMGAAHGQ
jgi:hypothetical protein